MTKSILGKVMWVGRATVFLVGLAVILAVVLGAASMAFAANGQPFLLGDKNVATAVTALTKKGSGPALDLRVGYGPPLKVNSDDVVDNLHADMAVHANNADNADNLDGQDSGSFAPRSAFGAANVIDTVGPLPVEGTYTSKGGTLLISASGSGFRSSTVARGGGLIGMVVYVDGEPRGVPSVLTNERDSHRAFVDGHIVVGDLPAGTHTIELARRFSASFWGTPCNANNESYYDYCTSTNDHDFFSVSVVELPD